MKKIIAKTSLLILALSLTIVACKKDKKEDPEQDKDTAAASDNSYSENMANDIVLIGNQALDNSNNTLSTFRGVQPADEAFLTACASSIVVDTTLKRVTVTFNNTVCSDGRTRSGSLTYDYSQSTNGAKHYRSPGFKCVVTASNYKVDGNAITINSKSIQNTTTVGFNPASTNITWTITSDISVTKTDGGVVTWNCTRYKTLLNTADTNVYRNDTIPIVWTKARVGLTGSASGVTAQGNSYTSNIISQLVRDFNCAPGTYAHRHPFIQGVVEFTPQGKQTRRIDFGSGACDQLATLTIGTYTTTITLP